MFFSVASEKEILPVLRSLVAKASSQAEIPRMFFSVASEGEEVSVTLFLY